MPPILRVRVLCAPRPISLQAQSAIPRWRGIVPATRNNQKVRCGKALSVSKPSEGGTINQDVVKLPTVKQLRNQTLQYQLPRPGSFISSILPPTGRDRTAQQQVRSPVLITGKDIHLSLPHTPFVLPSMRETTRFCEDLPARPCHDSQYTLFLLPQSSGKIDGGSRLANPTLMIQNSYNFVIIW